MWSVVDPAPEDVYIEDIAIGLARACRYAGQLHEGVEFYSTAEHSTLMTVYAIDNGLVEYCEDALAIHLHDASESMMGDMVSPRKTMLPDYCALESRAQDVMMEGMGLTKSRIGITKAEIKSLDLRIRIDERKALILEPALSAGMAREHSLSFGMEPLGVKIEALPPFPARDAFLETFMWCCERLPMRDPSNERLLAQARRVAPRYSTLQEVTEPAF